MSPKNNYYHLRTIEYTRLNGIFILSRLYNDISYNDILEFKIYIRLNVNIILTKCQTNSDRILTADYNYIYLYKIGKVVLRCVNVKHKIYP